MSYGSRTKLPGLWSLEQNESRNQASVSLRNSDLRGRAVYQTSTACGEYAHEAACTWDAEVLGLVGIASTGKQGLGTLKEILAIDSAAVVFTMSGRDEDYQDVATRLGARRGFRKPVALDILLSAIREERASRPQER